MEKIKRFLVVHETHDAGLELRTRIDALGRIYVCIAQDSKPPHDFKIWTGKGGDGPFGPKDGIWFEYEPKELTDG